MRTHVTRTVSSCFAVLRQIRSIRRSVSPSVVQSLIVSLVLSRLDYGSATLAGLPACLLDSLQSVLNAAERLVYRSRSTTTRCRCCATSIGCVYRNASRFGSRCWRTAARMDSHHRTSPTSSTGWLMSSHGGGCVRRRLRRWLCQSRRTLQSVTAPFLSLLLGRGTDSHHR